MLAAVAKRTKRTLFDELYISLASSSNKSKNKKTKKHTVSSSVHSHLWIKMSSNARPLGDHVTKVFPPHFFQKTLIGDYTTQLYGDYFISHLRIPKNQPV